MKAISLRLLLLRLKWASMLQWHLAHPHSAAPNEITTERIYDKLGRPTEVSLLGGTRGETRHDWSFALPVNAPINTHVAQPTSEKCEISCPF